MKPLFIIVAATACTTVAFWIFLEISNAIGFASAIACYLSLIGIFTISMILISMDKR